MHLQVQMHVATSNWNVEDCLLEGDYEEDDEEDLSDTDPEDEWEPQAI